MYYQDLPMENLNIPKFQIDQSKLDIDIKQFNENDIIIINSGTSTGKTRDVASILSKVKKENERILSIVNLISLAREQISTFKEVGNIDLLDYQDGVFGFDTLDGVICINSLLKLQSIKNADFSNVILYIDEVDDLIKSFTHNDSLDVILKPVYIYLLEIIRKCKKIILSDATINQNTLNLIGGRKNNNKTVLVKNINKKYAGIKATCCNDENIFLTKLQEAIKNKEYFLFGSDICSKIEFYHDNLIKMFPDQKDSFILITSKRKYKILSASSQFKDKYVFYSPSVKTGVSFYIEKAQKQFIYIGEKSITPIGNYQQTCRTRNMKELIYYCTDQKETENPYKTLNELEQAYKKMIERSKLLNDMCLNINKDDELEFVENTFFKQFCYEEYLRRIYKTGYKKHFENYLESNGFVINYIGEKDKLDRNVYEIFKMEKELKDCEDFDEFKQIAFFTPQEGLFDENVILTPEQEIEKEKALNTAKELNKYPLLTLRHNLLQVPKEDIDNYLKYYTDEHILKKYYGILNLFRKDEYIKERILKKKENSFYVKVLFDIINKIDLLAKFEKHYKIERFNLDMETINPENKINNEFVLLCKDVFRLEAFDLGTKKDIKDSYISMLKNISGCKSYKDELSLISQKRTKTTRENIINTNTMKEILTLLKYSNPFYKNMDIALIERMTGLKPDTDEAKRQKHIPDDYETYKYKKTFKL